jgi:hypothetical protein
VQNEEPRPAPPLVEPELVLLGVVAPLPLPPPLPLPVPVAPVPPPPLGLAPPDAEAPDVPLEPPGAPAPPEEAGAPLEEPDEGEPDDDAGVGVVAVVRVVVVAADTAALAEPPDGTVSAGAPVVSPAEVELPPPPQADRPTASAPLAISAASVVVPALALPTIAYEPSGSIRLPQCGQSFRSFWQS